MSWIRTIDWKDADEEVDALYGAAGDRATGTVDHILAVHSLSPAGGHAHMALYSHAMTGTPGLSRAEREMIAVAVSTANGCHY